MASRKLLTALACAVAQLAQLTQTAAAAPSDVFFVHLNGVQGINAGRAGTQGDLWFARNPNVVGHVSSTGILTNVVVPDAQRLSLIAPASSSAAWVVDGLGASISLIAAGRAGKPVALPAGGSAVDLAARDPQHAWVAWREPDELVLASVSAVRAIWHAPSGTHVTAVVARGDTALIALDRTPGLVEVRIDGTARALALPAACSGVSALDSAPDDSLWLACADGHTAAVMAPNGRVQLIPVPDIQPSRVFAVSHDSAWLYDATRSTFIGLCRGRPSGSFALGDSGLPGVSLSQLVPFVAVDSQQYLWFANNRSIDITRRGPLYDLAFTE